MAADASVTAVHRFDRLAASPRRRGGVVDRTSASPAAATTPRPGAGALVALWLVATYLVMGGHPAGAARPDDARRAGAPDRLTWLSLLWSDDVDQTVLEGQRTLLYVAVAAALVLVVRRVDVEPLLGGTLIGIFLPAGYGLLTRLFPDRIGVFDLIAGYRLQEPVGYWNALGLFAAMGAALALGFAARGGAARPRPRRSIPADPAGHDVLHVQPRSMARARRASSSLLPSTRGDCTCSPWRSSWRLRRASPSGSHPDRTLTRTDAPLSAATDEGHRLALSPCSQA